MNICSFVPGATEVIAALGLADHLVGISHECDYPPSIRRTPVLIEPVLGQTGLSSSVIDEQMRALLTAGQPLYRLNEPAFLAAKPDLILTQDLCHVCAVTPDHLTRAIRSLAAPPRVVTLNPTTLEDTILDVERIAKAAEALAQGQALTCALRSRLDAVHARATAMPPVRVASIEWLDPLYLAGHWIPEMVRLAGGSDVLGQPGQSSRRTTWAELESARPDVLLVMPCGYSVDRTLHELATPGDTQRHWLRALQRWPTTYAVDANAYFSRPGPRLIDGVELLDALLHDGPSSAIDRTNAVRLTADALAAGDAP